MSKTILIINQKGGVAKTTTALNLAFAFRNQNKKVLLIDLDNQCNLTDTMKASSNKPSIYNVFTSDINNSFNIVDAIQTINDIDFIRCDFMFSKLENEISNERVNEQLKSIKSNYDFIIVDTPPRINKINTTLMINSDYVLIPTQADFYSLRGISQITDIINKAKQFNKKLSILGLLITRFNARQTLSQDINEILNELAKKHNTRVFNTKIRECIAIKESEFLSKDIFSYSPKSNGAQDYKNLCFEIMELIK